jgi:hypothetical protein
MTWLPMEGFSKNLIFEDSLKICGEKAGFIKNLTRIRETLH